MQTLKKAINLLTPHERKQGIRILLLAIGIALLETAGVASVMPFLAVLGNPEMVTTNPVLSALYSHAQAFGVRTRDDFLIALGIGTFIMIIITAVYRIVAQYAMSSYVEFCQQSLSVRMLEAYLRQPYTFFLDRHSGDMSKTILSEVDHVIAKVFRPTILMVSSILLVIAITALLVLVNPWLVFVAASLLGGFYVLVFLTVKHKLSRLGSSVVDANRLRFMIANEAFGAIKQLKLLGREDSYLRRFNKLSLRLARASTGYATITQAPRYLIEAIALGSVIIIILVFMITAGGLNNNALGVTLPIIGLYTFAAYRLQPAIQVIFAGLAGLRYGCAAVDNLYKDLQRDSAPCQHPPDPLMPLRAKQTIALRKLSYTYPNATKPTLNNIDLDISIGSTVGVVGSTGAGKTTLVDVILGLLRPSKGEITIDEIAFSDEQVRAWQQSIGYVPQDIFLADATIAENIAFGIPPEEIDHAQVESCARTAQIHEFIVNNLSEQYRTSVGERGVRLSGGQRQRLGIARALYNDPELMVFDEATSALDTTTEHAVMDAIEVLAGRKTIIIIAHRLNTVRSCDFIVLLDQGSVKAKGTYSELMERDHQFKLMVNSRR